MITVTSIEVLMLIVKIPLICLIRIFEKRKNAIMAGMYRIIIMPEIYAIGLKQWFLAKTKL